MSPRDRLTYFIYAVEDLPGEVDLDDEFDSNGPDVSSPGNEYGTTFKLADFQDDFDPDLTGKQSEKHLKNLVPDAPETGERWATLPVVADLIGIIQGGELSIWDDEDEE